MQSKKCLRCNKIFFKTSNISQIVWETSRKFCSCRCRAFGMPSPKKGKQYLHLWRSDVTYQTLHLQVYKKYGKAKKCSHCGTERNVEWANKSNKYKSVDDFIELCGSCHRKYDFEMNGTIPWNKGKKGVQVAWNKGKARTWTVSGDFKKGHTPWNKGIPNSGFKKGYIPWNKKV